MKKHSSQPGARADARSGPAADREVETAIDSMGSQGHGVGFIDGRKVFIPFTLPGETVRVRLHAGRAAAITIESASPGRVEPICRHFGSCGGCSLQHWREASYVEWKTGLVRAALAREGLDATVEPLRSYPVASRRRATLAARKEHGAVKLGYKAARSHDLADLAECPILLPQIVSAFPRLRAALAATLPERSEARILITAAENGLDCSIEAPKPRAEALANFTRMLSGTGVIRAAWNDEAVFFEAVPFVRAGGVHVELPHGAFLQAVEACERDMAAFTGEALAETGTEKGPLCDLFAGLGAFTFPCAKRASVTAFEGNAGAVAALSRAAKGAAGIKPVQAIRRDLFRNPLGALELNAFAAVIADPPREGAEAQCRALAQSKIGAIIMLSCNPVTFARDAAILAGGGFRVSRLAVFDQFRFSPHIEIAAAFVRRGSKKGGLAPAPRR